MKQLTPNEEKLWQEQDQMRSELIDKLMAYSMTTYGDIAIHEAWNEFHGWPDDFIEFDPAGVNVPVFISWFFYRWSPDYPESEVEENEWTVDLSPAASMLKREGSELTSLESDYLTACLHEPITFSEVVSVQKGVGITLLDLFTNCQNFAVEKMASTDLQAGSIILSQAVTLNQLTTLEICSPFSLPASYKSRILKFKNEILEEGESSLTSERLFEFDLELLDLYSMYGEELFTPKKKTQNRPKPKIKR